MADETASPDSSTRWLETSRGILSYSELAPLLAERVLRVQERIETDGYADCPVAEVLILTLHRDFCGDLVPDWAGRWRTVAVRVGAHEPPAPPRVPEHMRQYALDLQARLEDPLPVEQVPEALAFAEGRLLSIHPFADFNGRLAPMALGIDAPPAPSAGFPDIERTHGGPRLSGSVARCGPTRLPPAGGIVAAASGRRRETRVNMALPRPPHARAQTTLPFFCPHFSADSP